MAKKITLLGVCHQQSKTDNSLVHPNISIEILSEFSKEFSNPNTIVIMEDAGIPENIHHCKCGMCLATDMAARKFIFERLFGKSFESQYLNFCAQLTVADNRRLGESKFMQYDAKIWEIVKKGLIQFPDPEAFSLVRMECYKDLSIDDMFSKADEIKLMERKMFYDTGLLTFDKSQMLSELGFYLKDGHELHLDFLKTVLVDNCDKIMLDAARSHHEEGVFDTIILIAGMGHTKTITKVLGIDHVYKNYATAEMLLSGTLEQPLNVVAWSMLRFPNSFLWDVLFEN